MNRLLSPHGFRLSNNGVAVLERIPFIAGDWARTLDTFPDRIVYQTPEWLEFIAETQRGEVVVAALKDGDETLGYLSAVIVRKFGMKILGSPFRAWTCPYMGFVLRPGVSRRAAAMSLPAFAFKELGCVHFEIADYGMRLEDISGLGFTSESRETYIVDLTPDQNTILAAMNSYRRRDIRRAEKHGLRIEEAQDEAMADEFSEQLKDVFAKQGLVPTFGVERVRTLIRRLQPTGMLHMLRAVEPGGRCAATGLFLGTGQTGFYWGGASWREFQNLHPNELIQWHAMKHWKARGMKSYNLVGTMEFKARFGGQLVPKIMISKSRYRWFTYLRTVAPRVLRGFLKATWRIQNLIRHSENRV